MKKLILLLGIGLALSIQAQDTLIMKDGSRLLAQIISMDSENIRYKSWTNMSGPTWVKSRQDVQMIKRGQRIVLHPGETLNFADCTNTTPIEECPSGDDIVGQIDGIYEGKPNFKWAKNRLAEYLESLPSCIQKKCIYKYYLNRYELSKEMGVVEYVLQDGETYLLLGGEDQLAEVVETLVTLYAADGKEGMVSWWMDFFKAYSEENDDLFAEDIKRLDEKKEEIMHPYRWEDDIKGKWVVLNRISNKSDYNGSINTECPLILDVRDVNIPTGAYMVEPTQKVSGIQRNKTSDYLYPKPINSSQAIYFDGMNNYALFQFGTMKISDGRWKTNIAHSILENTKEMRVKMNAAIYGHDASLKEKIHAKLMVSVTASVLETMATNMNTSSKTDEVYNILVYPNSPNVMNSFVTHVSTETISPTNVSQDPRVVYNEYVKDKKSYLVRWEDSDSICFVSRNGNPITLHPVDKEDPLLNEYQRIKYKHSISNPQIFLPIIGFNALTIAAFVHGMKLSDQSLDNGCVHDELLYRKALIYMLGGGFACALGNGFTISIVMDHKKQAFDELNLKNLEKLRRKASASLSMSPTYYPSENALGAAVQLSF